MDITLFM